MKIKIPNYLTIGRIIIVPFFVFAFYLPGFYGDIIPFVLFIIASFTDFLDGLLARMFKEESKLGELLDPIADKIIVAAALILLVMNGTIKNYEVIAAIIILTREILVSGLREFLAKGQIKLPVSNLAKLKTFLQMFSIAILLTGETGNKIINFQDYNAQTIGIILLWLSAFLTLYTGYEYLRKGIDHAISEDEKSQAAFFFLTRVWQLSDKPKIVLQTLNLKSAIQETGVTSAAVPVKKHPTNFDNSFGDIFL